MAGRVGLCDPAFPLPLCGFSPSPPRVRISPVAVFPGLWPRPGSTDWDPLSSALFSGIRCLAAAVHFFPQPGAAGGKPGPTSTGITALPASGAPPRRKGRRGRPPPPPPATPPAGPGMRCATVGVLNSARKKRHLHPEHLPYAGDHARSQERVPAQLEEAVVHPHPLDPQHLRPDLRQQLLARVAGGRRTPPPPGPPARGAPAGPSSRWEPRERVQRHPRGGDHVLRQRPPSGAPAAPAASAPPSPGPRRPPAARARARPRAPRRPLRGRPGARRRTPSTSPGSTRKPRTLTCVVHAPQVLQLPVRAASAPRSPVRYEPRAAGPPENGSGTKRSAVSSGRPR